MMGGAWRRTCDWARVALDVIYPPACAGCGKPTASAGEMCDACLSTTRRIVPPFCEVCGEHFEGEINMAFQCSNCAGRKFAFEFAIGGYESAGVVREMIHRFKYRGDFYLRRQLGEMLGEVMEDPRIASGKESWLLVPVPLHPRRRREREFNQAEELAMVFGKNLGLPMASALKRTRYTTQQAHLDRADRLRALKGAFALRWGARKKLAGRDILLVDDVFTTGSTSQECAKVLRDEGGARKVVVVTVARG